MPPFNSPRNPAQFPGWILTEMDINKIKFKALFQNIASRQKSWKFSTVNRLDVDFIAFKQHSEWLQFSGLHDKDGHEIYEGDLLQWEDYVVTVVFEVGSFKVSKKWMIFVEQYYFVIALIDYAGLLSEKFLSLARSSGNSAFSPNIHLNSHFYALLTSSPP